MITVLLTPDRQAGELTDWSIDIIDQRERYSSRHYHARLENIDVNAEPLALLNAFAVQYNERVRRFNQLRLMSEL